MAFYADEGEVWKCPKHPSKRRHVCGICPLCLTDRLSALCPDCAHPLPCSCSATSSSPSSSSSSLSHFSSEPPPFTGVRVSALIAGEPAFRRSSSVAAIRSRFAGANSAEAKYSPKSSIWSLFKTRKTKREKIDHELPREEYDQKTVMMRSRSVVSATSSPAKGKGWYFPSPMKAFRQTKSSKVVQERSPLYRG